MLQQHKNDSDHDRSSASLSHSPHISSEVVQLRLANTRLHLELDIKQNIIHKQAESIQFWTTCWREAMNLCAQREIELKEIHQFAIRDLQCKHSSAMRHEHRRILALQLIETDFYSEVKDIKTPVLSTVLNYLTG